jgi:hypothetical protein
MTFPIFPLPENERAAIYGILKRYPAQFGKKFEFNWGPFHPSMRVSGLVTKLIGPEPQ